LELAGESYEMRRLMKRMTESLSRMLGLHLASDAGLTSVEARQMPVEAALTSVEDAARLSWAGGHCEESFPCVEL